MTMFKTVGYILGDVAEVLDLGLQPPVPLVFSKKGMLVKESETQLADERSNQ